MNRRKLTDAKALELWQDMGKKHATEKAGLVVWIMESRSMQQVATLLNYSPKWVRDQIKLFAVASAVGGGDCSPPLESGAGNETKADVQRIVADYKPEEPDEGYVQEYEAAGHTPEVAKALASAYEAGENAIDAGVIEVPKHKEAAAKITLPAALNWERKLNRTCGDIRAACRLLDDAKMTDLKRAMTRDKIAAVHARWMEQIERIRNLHPTFDEEVVAAEES